MSDNKIAENLKKLRAKKGLSLEKIARLAGYFPAKIASRLKPVDALRRYE